MRLEHRCRKSGSKGYQSAVMPSAEVIALSAMTYACVRWSPCTPTERMGRNTANACQILSYRPSSRSMLMKISSTSLSVSSAPGWVTEPRQRTARPGPGKGWRFKNTLGTSMSAPILRTSSLKRNRSGSASSNPRSLGRPPTLWCDLMVCECFMPLPGGGQLSITSGYSVPWTRNLGTTPVFFSTSSLNSLNTLMNSAPMILRLVSGSATPSSLLKVRSVASTMVTPRCRFSLNIFSTLSRSLYLSRPLSTKQQWRRSPMALCTSVAATAESTPPDSAQMACSLGPI
mmetsp:Transcript_24890/g.41612  ORF Transcript_24890/g.41612 Transcript_24890/m.41612 type:complete len:287 (+) Transcript_24890:501-1361(+)